MYEEKAENSKIEDIILPRANTGKSISSKDLNLKQLTSTKYNFSNDMNCLQGAKTSKGLSALSNNQDFAVNGNNLSDASTDKKMQSCGSHNVSTDDQKPALYETKVFDTDIFTVSIPGPFPSSINASQDKKHAFKTPPPEKAVKLIDLKLQDLTSNNADNAETKDSWSKRASVFSEDVNKDIDLKSDSGECEEPKTAREKVHSESFEINDSHKAEPKGNSEV